MYYILCALCFFFRQKTAYEMRISDWSSDVCSSDLCKSTLPPTLRRWPLGTSSTLQLARRLCRLPPLHHLAGQGQTSGDRRRTEEHTSELQSTMRISYAVFCLKKKTTKYLKHSTQHYTITRNIERSLTLQNKLH